MIFRRLTFCNFGVFNGRHELDLTPSADNKPLVLIGGMNGAGKTTILDAVQLALYGQFAQCSNRGKSSYKKFLAKTVHYTTKSGEKTFIQLEFELMDSGTPLSIEIIREWSVRDDDVDERFEARINGEEESAVSENWIDFIDDHLPRYIASLFFFDGEKVEDLADPSTSAKIIEAGVASLLGLDLIDRLAIDLRRSDRLRRKRLGSEISPHIQAHETNLENLEVELGEVIAAKASANSRLDSFHSQIRETEEVYQQLGGKLFDQREQVKTDKKKASDAHKLVQTEVLDFVGGAGPLLLVQDLVKETKSTSESEEEIILNRELLPAMKKRDKRILDAVKGEVSEKAFHALLERLMKNDHGRRSRSAKKATFLNVRSHEFNRYDKGFFKGLETERSALAEKLANRKSRYFLVRLFRYTVSVQ